MGALYTNETLLQTIFITFVVGCGCAWRAGRSIALTWRSVWTAAGAMILLGLAVRFLHFALFQERLLMPTAYLFETGCLIVVAALSWRHTRAQQMVRQYYWLYEANGPLGWRPRRNSEARG
jgi:Domain of unknown function (DUF6867)